MARAFEEADLLEVYAAPSRRMSPIGSGLGKLGEIRRNKQPVVWRKLIAAIRESTGGDQAQAIWDIGIRLRKGDREVAVGYLLAPTGELAMRVKGKEYGRVWAGPFLRQTFEPFRKRFWLMAERDPKLRELGRPPVHEPPVPAFSVVKARVVELFEKAERARFLKSYSPEGTVDIDSKVGHRRAWRRLLQGVKESKPGARTHTWPPEYWIAPILRHKPNWAKSDRYELRYASGVLYCRELELGGMRTTLKLSPKFAEGLALLLRSLNASK